MIFGTIKIKVLKIPIHNIDQIKRLLPHREPMIMVDKLLEFSEGKATVEFTIRADNIFVSNNNFSETGLIEHMAQAAALYIGYKNYAENTAPQEGFIAAIKKLHIYQLPHVDEILETKVTILHEIMHLSAVKVSTFINDLEISHAEMNTVLKED